MWQEHDETCVSSEDQEQQVLRGVTTSPSTIRLTWRNIASSQGYRLEWREGVEGQACTLEEHAQVFRSCAKRFKKVWVKFWNVLFFCFVFFLQKLTSCRSWKITASQVFKFSIIRFIEIHFQHREFFFYNHMIPILRSIMQNKNHIFLLETQTLSLGFMEKSTCELQDSHSSNVIVLYSSYKTSLSHRSYMLTSHCLVFFSFVHQCCFLLIVWYVFCSQGVVCRASPFPAASPATTWRVFSPTQNISSPFTLCTRVVRRAHRCPLRPEVSATSARGRNAQRFRAQKKIPDCLLGWWMCQCISG